MTGITCCKDCTQRHYACHSTCEKYKQQRAELDEYNARRRQEQAEYSYTMKVLLKSSAILFSSRHFK